MPKPHSKKKDIIKTTLRISKPLNKWYQEAAEEDRRTKNHLMTDVLEAYAKGEVILKKKKIKTKLFKIETGS